MKVVVACNDDLELKPHLNEIERIGESEVLETAKEVADILEAALLPVRDVGAALATLRRIQPDVVVNLCEGVAGRPDWEMHFGLALEMLRIPFTGSDPIAVGICGDKALTKKILAAGGVSVPEAGDGPWIVKPSREDAGIGIDAASVCHTAAEREQRKHWVETTYKQPALVEEFIDGRELNQAVYYGPNGIVLLPPGEIIFDSAVPAAERVVGWKAKWASGSAEDRATINRTPAMVDDSVRTDLAAICTRAATLLSLGGYCRFDLRQRASGELVVIDVNPNPDIGRGTGFRKALAAAGIDFADFLNELIISTLS